MALFNKKATPTTAGDIMKLIKNLSDDTRPRITRINWCLWNLLEINWYTANIKIIGINATATSSA